MTRYTIAICNKNMASTIERSIRSIARQVDDEYEILVVDDNSTDGSRAILDDLADELPSLRIVDGDNRNLAEARNQSFEAARGEFVLESLDADDYYEEGIGDFVELYEQLQPHVDDDFYLKGDSINMAPRDLLLEYPYRSMFRAEDHDLWKRLFADDAIVWLNHEVFWEELNGSDPSFWDTIEIDLKSKTSIFRSDTTLRSAFQYFLTERSVIDPTLYYNLCACLVSYVIAYRRGVYNCPAEFTEWRSVEKCVNAEAMTADQLESEYDFEFDRSAFSDAGTQIFFGG